MTAPVKIIQITLLGTLVTNGCTSAEPEPTRVPLLLLSAQEPYEGDLVSEVPLSIDVRGAEDGFTVALRSSQNLAIASGSAKCTPITGSWPAADTEGAGFDSNEEGETTASDDNDDEPDEDLLFTLTDTEFTSGPRAYIGDNSSKHKRWTHTLRIDLSKARDPVTVVANLYENDDCYTNGPPSATTSITLRQVRGNGDGDNHNETGDNSTNGETDSSTETDTSSGTDTDNGTGTSD